MTTVGVQFCLCGHSRTRTPSIILLCLPGPLFLSHMVKINMQKWEGEREITVRGLPLELKNDPKVEHRALNNIPLI